MCKSMLGSLMVLIVVSATQAASAGEGRYRSRMDLYQAQARRYVADRTQLVATRSRYAQPQAAYHTDSPCSTQPVSYYPPRQDTGDVGIVRNPSYRSDTVVRVVADDVDDDVQDVVIDDDYADDDAGGAPVIINRTYIVEPAPYVGYSAYHEYPVYRSYPAYRCPPVYRHYPVYRDYPAYYGSVHYRHGYYPYRGHCGPRYGGYYGGHYGHHRGHGSHWGVSVHFEF